MSNVWCLVPITIASPSRPTFLSHYKRVMFDIRSSMRKKKEKKRRKPHFYYNLSESKSTYIRDSLKTTRREKERNRNRTLRLLAFSFLLPKRKRDASNPKDTQTSRHFFLPSITITIYLNEKIKLRSLDRF